MTVRSAPDSRTIDERLSFGVINLDKPPGPSSHQVCAWIKDVLGIDRAGHAGTLDPKVTGCLPVLLGDATRMARALVRGQKEYVVVLELHDDPPETLSQVLAEFEGEIYQKPPRKSAVTRRLRTRRVHALDVLEISGRQVLLDVRCERGTYVRKLCHDLGLALGVGAHMGALRRIATTPFDDTSLVTMHELADAVADADEGRSDALRSIVHPGERALTHLPTVTIARNAARTVATGAPVFAPGVIHAEAAQSDDLVVCHTPDGAAVCLGTVVGDLDATEGEVISLERVLV